MMMMMMMMIALKGENRYFLQSPHYAVDCPQHVRSSGPGAIVCKSCATQRALITCNMQCAIWQSWNRMYINLSLLAETIDRWSKGEGEDFNIQRKPTTTSFRKCQHIKACVCAIVYLGSYLMSVTKHKQNITKTPPQRKKERRKRKRRRSRCSSSSRRRRRRSKNKSENKREILEVNAITEDSHDL